MLGNASTRDCREPPLNTRSFGAGGEGAGLEGAGGEGAGAEGGGR